MVTTNKHDYQLGWEDTCIYIMAKLEKSLSYSEITIEYGILLGLYDMFGTINSGTRVEHAQVCKIN